MDSRRKFIGAMATGLASTLASSGRVLGANSRLRLGIIGAGDRGTELARQALECPDIEVTAVADIYARRLETAARLFPGTQVFSDYRRMLDQNSIDAIVIATPQHLHTEQLRDALQAGKHVYVENTLGLNSGQAKRARDAYRAVSGRLVVQIGHQTCSSGHVADAESFLAAGGMGRITAIAMRMYRNTPQGKAPWTRPTYPDMNAANISWSAFQGEAAPPRPFDADRYINWRFFWDYSGGNVHESFSHQLAFWYRVLNLRIPRAATMSGGVYLWKDGREVPDTMTLTLEPPEGILITWHSGFGNNQPGMGEDVLGTNGTILRTQQIRYVPQKVNRPAGEEILGRTPTAPNAHLADFFDAIRSAKPVNCSVELGYCVSVACAMAVESFRRGRTVYWDAQAEEIV